MSVLDYEKAKMVFDNEVENQKRKLRKGLDSDEIYRRTNLMDRKVNHTEQVVVDGTKVMEGIGFSESVISFGKIALLNHDIGRFAQMRLTGSYVDSELEEVIGIKNHGELGDIILINLMNDELPDARFAHVPISKIVRNHVNKKVSPESLQIIKTDLLKNFDIEEALIGNSDANKVIDMFTQIVQDVDRLDIYHQIISGAWVPEKSDEPVPSLVMSKFYNGEYIDIPELKQQRLWNPNVGEVVRLTFINNIKLLSVAKMIQSEGILDKLKAAGNNPQLDEAFNYAKFMLDHMIVTSPDGILTGKVKTK